MNSYTCPGCKKAWGPYSNKNFNTAYLKHVSFCALSTEAEDACLADAEKRPSPGVANLAVKLRKKLRSQRKRPASGASSGAGEGAFASPAASSSSAVPEVTADTNCAKCKRHIPAKTLIVCDKCEREWHLTCHDPPIPEGSHATRPGVPWCCSECKTAGTSKSGPSEITYKGQVVSGLHFEYRRGGLEEYEGLIGFKCFGETVQSQHYEYTFYVRALRPGNGKEDGSKWEYKVKVPRRFLPFQIAHGRLKMMGEASELEKKSLKQLFDGIERDNKLKLLRW